MARFCWQCQVLLTVAAFLSETMDLFFWQDCYLFSNWCEGLKTISLCRHMSPRECSRQFHIVAYYLLHLVLNGHDLSWISTWGASTFFELGAARISISKQRLHWRLGSSLNFQTLGWTRDILSSWTLWLLMLKTQESSVFFFWICDCVLCKLLLLPVSAFTRTHSSMDNECTKMPLPLGVANN